VVGDTVFSRNTSPVGEKEMKDLAFGLIVTLVGMGVTLLTLYILTLVIRLLDRLFPFKAEEKKGK
jgi:Na+-transporting methylmalonyl-CoA/oxaloacetate decarboxylase gamma subunit